MYQSHCDLFKSPALTWYNNNHSNFKNWSDVISKLKEDFLSYFYEDVLEKEISARTQGFFRVYPYKDLKYFLNYLRCIDTWKNRVWSEPYRPSQSLRNGLLVPDLSCPVSNNAFYTSYNRNYNSGHVSSSNFKQISGNYYNSYRRNTSNDDNS